MKFILLQLILLIMRLLALLPFKIQLLLAKLITPLCILLFKNRYKIAKININKCLKHLDKTVQRRIIKQHFTSLCMFLFEIANCLYLSKNRLKKRYQFDNKALLQQILDKKQNVIIVTAHFTTMLMAGRILADNFHVVDIYKPSSNKISLYIMQLFLTKSNIDGVAVKDIRTIIAKLKSGLPIWYSMDQDILSKNSVFIDFFGIKTNTITTTSKLANIANAKVLYLNFIRQDKYYLKFELFNNFPTNNTIIDTVRISKMIEKQILSAPEQYMWIHRRFKNRPAGEKSFY